MSILHGKVLFSSYLGTCLANSSEKLEKLLTHSNSTANGRSSWLW